MAGLRDDLQLSVAEVTATIPEDWLPFETSDEVPIFDAVFGQERAVRAIEFALGMNAPGYNLFASGPDGFGKSTIVQMFLRRRAQGAAPPLDWVYVHNFEDPDRPQAMSLPPGRAHAFATSVRHTVDSARRELSTSFESESYVRMRQELIDRLERDRAEILEGLQREAQGLGFALNIGPQGISTSPLIEGKPATEEQFAALDEAKREEIQQQGQNLEKIVQDALFKMRGQERNAQSQMEQLDRDTAAFALSHLLDPLLEEYGHDQEVRQFLEAVRDDLAENRDAVRGEGQRPAIPGLPIPQAEPTRKYEVNVFVSNDPQGGAPVVAESHPTYYNLMGRIEYQGALGGASTDHTFIRSGSVARANGGYLVIRLRDLLVQPAAFDALKRTMLASQLQVENLSENLQLIPTTGLRPEPIPLQLKVILVGDPLLHSLLFRHDPDFRELFRVKADFETELDRTRDNANGLASIVRGEVERRGLRPFTRAAICRMVEHSSRMVEDRRRLSANMSTFLDIVRQADYWAGHDGDQEVHERHVLRALEERTYRSSLVAERILEAMEEGTITVATDGERVGQINALSVYDLGDISFGRPSRITCVTSAGRGSIVMVERESDMAGRIHNKGFLILRGFLAYRFGQDKASLFHASLTFEQLYGDIDGDSASSTELYVLLSSLAGVPIDQRVAVTGSVDQMGNIQPIGGAAAKIEGFFEVCRARGLTGDQGVMIPRSNIPNVVLRREVAEAIEAGQFHVWAVDTIEQGLEVLTGHPAGGERDAEGRFAEGTIYRMVEDRLAQFQAQLERRPPAGQQEPHIPVPARASYPTPPGIPDRPPPEPPIIV
ncbi:MAG: AAA family ATPase [Dehalococcoidia bacterium]|nr:AAA family ATPase [Dehalococcoidia bacterium]